MANLGEATELDDILIGGTDDDVEGSGGHDIIEGGSNQDTAPTRSPTSATARI